VGSASESASVYSRAVAVYKNETNLICFFNSCFCTKADKGYYPLHLRRVKSVVMVTRCKYNKYTEHDGYGGV